MKRTKEFVAGIVVSAITFACLGANQANDPYIKACIAIQGENAYYRFANDDLQKKQDCVKRAAHWMAQMEKFKPNE